MRKSVSVCHAGAAAFIAALGVVVAAVPAAASFVTFETGQVRPLALSPDGNRLYAVNTPDNRLEVFAVNASGDLTHSRSIPVGLEPIAVAIRPDGTQAWVVNHLSDSVSVIDLTGATPRVVRTLLVGDEPRDIVFAGPGGNRAFITAAHRGQNTPFHANIDTILKTAGIGRADVWVFNADNLGSALGGTPLTIITLFGDTPRALAANADGSIVYAAVFHSGNRTTAISEGAVCNGGAGAGPCGIDGITVPGGLPGGQVPGGLPAPNANIPQGITGPETGMVVKFNPASGQWRDQLNRNWTNAVRFNLPDKDVFAIDAGASPVPVAIAGSGGFFTDVGTVIFNMVVNPVDGTVYVSNTEAINEVRFEGPGGGGSTVRGRLHEARITALIGSNVLPRRLNKHIDYNVAPSPPGVKESSLATPLGMAVTSNGSTLYVAAFGSSKIGVYDTGQIELDTFTPALVPHISVSGGGPSGLALNEAKNRLYVLTRFDNAVAVINTASKTEIDHLPLHNPEPAHVVNGRPFLYDAFFTSSNGEASCSSCHVFGDFDSLAWDLGNPDDLVLTNLNPFRVPDPLGISFPNHHPLKGPMTTQSLRGMANHGPMHWRGDRSGANNPGGSALDEDAAFKRFNVAFEGLLGRSGPLATAEMQAFTDFILDVTYPPNPIRNLNDSLTPDQQAGRDFYFLSATGTGAPSDVFQTCNGCHVLDRAQGFFGSDGFSSFENEPQMLKIPHLRNMYQKVGMFGMPNVPFFNPIGGAHQGDQVRGFGFLHDGSVDTMFRFHQAVVFNQCIPVFGCINPGGFPATSAGETMRRQVESFMFAFDSNLAPIVGQQVTLTGANAAVVNARINLLIGQASSDYFPGTKHCDLIVKGVIAGEPRGWLYEPASNAFRSDKSAEPLINDNDLRALASSPGQELTYTCVPPGSGQRSGIDRDADGILDGDEDSCSPAPLTGCKLPGQSLLLMKATAGREQLSWKWQKGDADVSELGNPLTGATGYRLCIYGGTAADLLVEADVGPQGSCGGKPCWRQTGSGLKYKDKTLSAAGTQLITLKAGSPGKASALWKGKGSNLPLPQLPAQGLALPVTVQLNNSDGTCWEAGYGSSDVKKNGSSQFKAKR
jgi:YVTN family beta-propeller protein